MKKALSMLLVLFLIGILSGCAPQQVIVKVNGMQMAPETELQSHPCSKLSFTYSYYRIYKNKIRNSRGYEEEIKDTEPLRFSGDLHHLPKDTVGVGIMVYVDNPRMQQYKLVVIEDRGGTISEKEIYSGIRADNLVRHVFSTGAPLTKFSVSAKLILLDRNETLDFKGISFGGESR